MLAEFKQPAEALVFLNNHQVDLLFLDINMPGISGIDFARALDPSISVIFTTAYREYAPEGFELHAVDYLLKPISFERFLKAIHHYLGLQKKGHEPGHGKAASHEKPEDRYIMLRDSKITHKVPLKDIRYIESDGDYIRFYLPGKKLLIRGSLRSMEEELPASLFLRIHNSYIVNLERVNAFTSYSLEVEGTELPVGRSYREQVRKVLNQ